MACSSVSPCLLDFTLSEHLPPPSPLSFLWYLRVFSETLFPGSACEYSFYLPSTVVHLIIADFLFPKASGSIHSSQLQRTDLTLPYALAFILKPCLPLSWRPPSAPLGAHLFRLCSPPRILTPSPEPPALEVEVGVPPAPAVSPGQLQSGDGGAGSRVHSLWSLPPQLGLGLSGRPRPHPWRNGGHSRLPISDAGKCLPPIPPHPWTAAPIQAQGCWWGDMVSPAWEMLWSGSSSKVLTRPPCRENSASSQKVHTPPHKSF